MPRLLAALVALVVAVPALVVPAVAQTGFSAVNGRNHPEIDWRTATTEHFEIVYPAHLAGIEVEAASVAEAAFDALTANLGPTDSTAITFPTRIRLYLSDEDEITNGFAVDVGRAGFTNLWVNVNDAAETFSGTRKWLRTVIAHELAHIVHYRAVRSNVGLVGVFFGDALPRFWTEGLAQYQTERWDAQRGDRWLRTAVFEDRLSYEDGQSVQNGRLLYALGNSQVRHFAEQYGDSTLARVLAHRSSALFGLVRYNDFQTAFRKVVGIPYRDYNESWRQHVNVYYNTMAGQMERLDSLATPRLPVPGQVLYTVAYSPDTSRIAAVVLPSLARPVRRLIVVDNPRADTTRRQTLEIVAEGGIVGAIAWRPDGREIAFTRERRGRYGSLVRDLYTVGPDGRGLRRRTTDRRAGSPSYSPNGSSLAFVGSAGPDSLGALAARSSPTANVFVLDLATGAERALTAYTGDVQITGAAWSPDGARVAYAVFDPDGRRRLATVDVATGRVETLPVGDGVPEPVRDDRGPVWSPDSRRIAFTSLRDGAPNVFVADWASGAETRVTGLFAGATVTDWLPADSLHAEGRLVVVASETKRRDRAFAIDAARRPTVDIPPPAPDAARPAVTIPPAYAAWTTHTPPQTIADDVPPDPSLIQSRGRYRSLRNLTHAITLPFAYGDPGEDGDLFTSDDDWGVFANSIFLEPLGKHTLVALAGISVTRPIDKSFLLLSYTNRVFRPDLTLDLYRFPSPSSFYGNGVLVEDLTGGDLSATLPLDLLDRPYTTTLAGARLRYAYASPLAIGRLTDLDASGDTLFLPEAGTRFDVQVGFAYKFQRPYRYNVIFPLDGTGARLRVGVGIPGLGSSGTFVRPDLLAYWVSPSLGGPRLFVQGRATAQFGRPQLPQDFVGLSRTDDVDIQLPFVGAITLDDAERVRGYRRFAVGTRALWGSAELRLPVVLDLNTTILGLVRLGAVSPALFADGGLVWTGSDFGGAVRRLGVGTEVKNVIDIGGIEILHALGLGVPASRVGDVFDGTIAWDDVDFYYRIQAAVPF